MRLNKMIPCPDMERNTQKLEQNLRNDKMQFLGPPTNLRSKNSLTT